MKNWRKEFTNSLKELTKPNKDKKEEFTDIAQASTPKAAEPKKDKMEEIYSTKDKQVKYKRLTPLEAEAAAKKTQSTKEKLIQGKAEIALSTPETDASIVELTSEYAEGTVVSEEIIEDVEEIISPTANKNTQLDDSDKTGVTPGHDTLLKEYERQANDQSKHKERLTKSLKGEYEKLFGKPKYDVNSEKIVAKIPTYLHDSKVNLIVLKAGRFSDVVESEYDEYLKSNDPIISKRHDEKEHKSPVLNSKALMMHRKSGNKKENVKPKAEPFIKPEPPKKKSKIRKFFKILKILIFTKSETDPSVDKNNVPDYEGREDAKQVFQEISKNYKKLSVQAIVLSAMFILTLCSLTLIGTSSIPYSSLIYCGVNLLMLLLTGIFAKPVLLNGMKPLKNFRGNSDTALSCAYFACLIQQVASMFTPSLFTDSTFHLYTTVITLAFTLNTLGKVLMVSRIKSNFRFITANAPVYSVKTLNDNETARKMLSGTTASKSTIVYQHPTRFLSDFLKISYAPDPSEELCGKLSPITLVSSVFVALMYGIISKNISGALCAFAVMSCISIPLCAMLTGNLPLSIFCKNALKHSAMVSGYPSVRQFSDCDALMVDANELYPKGCIKLNKIKNFAEYRVDDALLYAALVMKEAGNPLYTVLENHIKENAKHLPKVESVMYEDKLGLVGWVGGERVLVGNRNLLDRYNIYLEDAADESKFKSHSKDVTYIACSGQLVSMLVTTYTPDESLKETLYHSQKNGTCFVVSSTDCNITADKIASDYELYYRTVKVLSPGFATTCSQLKSRHEENSRAFLSTRGKLSSLLYCINGSINFKQNLTIGIIIEIFGLVLGVLLGATMVLYADVSILGITEIMLYMLFWSVATIVVQFIKRS